MKLSSTLFLSTVFGCALSHAFQLPDLPDGSYIITINGDGNPTWTDIAANTTDSPPPDAPKLIEDSTSSRLRKRFNWPSGTYAVCPGGNWFLQDEFYQRSWNAFYNTCYGGGEFKYPPLSALAQYQGTSVSYMCAYTTNPCRVEEWQDAVNWASGNCFGRSNGWMEPGMLMNEA